MDPDRTDTSAIIPLERIQQSIYLLRGEKVMLDKDLAALYGVPTKRLNEQVRRNLSRFPSDFMFLLTKEEVGRLRSQSATSTKGRGGARYRPYAFTEQGVAMLSSVLRSKRAVAVNIAIMRTFVQLRRILADNKLLRDRIEAIERKYDEQFTQVFTVLKEMLTAPRETKPPIGFLTEAQETSPRPKAYANRQGQMVTFTLGSLADLSRGMGDANTKSRIHPHLICCAPLQTRHPMTKRIGHTAHATI